MLLHTWLQHTEGCPEAILVCVPGLNQLLDGIEELAAEPPLGDLPGAKVILYTERGDHAWHSEERVWVQ